MAAWIPWIVMSAFGLVCVLWVLIGLFLPVRRGAAMVLLCRGDADEVMLAARYTWLYDLGLIHCPLVLVDCGMTLTQQKQLQRFQKGVIWCRPEEVSEVLRKERERLG